MGYLGGWLVGWLAGWLIDWLVGWGITQTKPFQEKGVRHGGTSPRSDSRRGKVDGHLDLLSRYIHYRLNSGI